MSIEIKLTKCVFTLIDNLYNYNIIYNIIYFSTWIKLILMTLKLVFNKFFNLLLNCTERHVWTFINSLRFKSIFLNSQILFTGLDGSIVLHKLLSKKYLRYVSDMFLPNGQNVAIWWVTRQKWHIVPQIFWEKAKNRQYLTKNVHIW